MKPLETTPEEVLRKAIESEVETRLYYQKMADRAGTPEVQRRMLQLADGEFVHRAKLERRYREVIGTPPPEPAVPTIELGPDLVNLDMAHALTAAPWPSGCRTPSWGGSSWNWPRSSGSTRPSCRPSTMRTSPIPSSSWPTSESLSVARCPSVPVDRRTLR